MTKFPAKKWWALLLASVALTITAYAQTPTTVVPAAPAAAAAPTGNENRVHPTKIVKIDGKWQLLRDGLPYFIKGAGGDASKEYLSEIGGNSFRTWGMGKETGAQLKEAQKLGLTVTLGSWLGRKAYFSYTNEKQCQDQKDRVQQEVERYMDSPPLLIWALGNEMESDFKEADRVPVFKHIQELAAMVHKLDPNHPTMTVVAEIGGNNVKLIHENCPDIDIIGINSYAGASSIAERYAKEGGTKPYIITEFGPPGVWEWHQTDNSYGAVQELNSTDKAEWYRNAYKGSIVDKPNSLGSYVFAWGSKQEATATWYGLIFNYNDEMYHSKAVDVVSEMFTGKPPAVRAPDVNSAKLEGVDPKVGCIVHPGEIVKASAEIKDPQNLKLIYKWHLHKDPQNYNTGGENQAAPPEFPSAIVKDGGTNVEVKMPQGKGVYRLFLFAYSSKGGVATANFPIKVDGDPIPKTQAEIDAEKPIVAKLPLVLYAEDGVENPYNPTGFMPAGIGKVLSLSPNCTDKPHDGKTCIKVLYNDTKGWGGIVWQHPNNDWGQMAGGYDLTGAKTLTFWARGENGGEKVSFGFGLLAGPKKPDQAFGDTSKGEAKDTILTKEWKQYSIDVAGKDLTRIKTGFYLVTGATNSEATTFYLDDIKFEGEAPKEAPGGTPKDAPK